MNNQFLGPMLGYLLVVLIVLAVIFLVLRELVCWYWKINQHIALLTEIRDLLSAKGISNASQTVTSLSSTGATDISAPGLTTSTSSTAPQKPDTGPRGICPNCDSQIALNSSECPKCKAQFGANSAWKIKPL